MPSKPQDLRNHARFVPLYHGVLTLMLLVNLGYWAYLTAFKGVNGLRVDGLLTALALLLLFVFVRVFPLTVQDRVIRLEMRLRMERLLPADLVGRFGELEPGQLVALRFAGDAELPGLVRRVLAGELRTNAQIKQQIKDWQADWLRA
jgi:hypothetical protein